jgi:hypothetical protein
LAPVALRAPSAKANTERQITCLQGGAKSDHQKGPSQVDETSSAVLTPQPHQPRRKISPGVAAIL